MHIFNPTESMNGVPCENMFCVADDSNITVANGYILQLYKQYIFPTCPVQFYLYMHAQNMGRDMLLGALIARASILREKHSNYPSRIFTQVNPSDASMLAFYQDAGFSLEDALDRISISVPNAKPSAPMGYTLGEVPLDTKKELDAFVNRMNLYRLGSWTPQQIMQYKSLPHFSALYISHGKDIVGEIMLAGEGDMAKVMGLYINSNYRHNGLAQNLLAAGMTRFQENGVTHFSCDVLRQNVTQCKLAQSCQAKFEETQFIYPSLRFEN